MILNSVFCTELNTDNQPAQYVLGGSCICYAKGVPSRLSLQDLIDSLLPAIIASQHNASVYLYFQSYEAIMMADLLHFEPEQANHKTMREWLEAGIIYVLEQLNIPLPPIHWVDTSEDKVRQHIDQLVPHIKTVLPESMLYGLYAKKPGATYPQGTDEEQMILDVYYRNIALYTPEFLSAALGILPKQALFVENTTQEKAIQIYYRAIRQNCRTLLYHPAPNTQGKEMCLGNSNHKIELRLTAKQLIHRVAKMGHDDYYKTIFNAHSIADIMQGWQAKVLGNEV
ncbi:hypothetical protein [Xenorhabdus szentirmaii]|uniref:hypothetical protein n=1 Tax=Xenorhabdus szentirmaii TaxID=290112 RepID=UPI0019B20250|nr:MULTISPECIES: hypothetical protein [unclassified Xenorhabdus]MBD2791153.1 hypothetical protein [Xenorhabdus sp. CUL]MBD2805657.1 hypothetical protein [Xenorhabdus sp. ZM]MBD2824233.1 hypothetical protein [Xenorhabdus sp. 5]